MTYSTRDIRRPSDRTDVVPSGRRKASTSSLQRKSKIRCRESVTRSTKMNSSGPTKPSVKSSSRSGARLGGRARVDLSLRFRFAVTVMLGKERRAKHSRFAFYTHYIAELPGRRYELAPGEVLRMNPNTGTLPMFRTRTDADITLGIYNRHFILIRDDDPDGNPWGLSFVRMFDMAGASGLFHQPADLAQAHFNGWSYDDGRKEYLPLYEAKMLNIFDHRFSTYRGATQKQLNKGRRQHLSMYPQFASRLSRRLA